METHVYRAKGNTIIGTPYRLAFFVWRRMPDSWRSLFAMNPLAQRIKTAGRDTLARFAGREDLYSSEYYTYVDVEASRSAPVIVESVVSHFAPRSLIDVGCGTGALLAAFTAKGISTVGLEYSSAGLKFCARRGLNVHRFDIENDLQQDIGVFDLAVCFEVAEHLSEKFADRLVDLLVSLAPTVVFTAAVPGQGGGADHINEQPNEYWIAKFERRGYRLLQDITKEWRQDWGSKDVAGFYAQNIMAFGKPSS